MKFLSVCSGIEAASVAWEPLGWKACAFSEIEPFPSAVLAHHWPDVPNLGDMTQYHGWPDTLRPDLIVGGTPCQAFSVAGLRKGLEDPRGNLTLVFLGLLERFRPRWVVWENVPGVLSDRTGAFGAFLGGLGELGYGFAYRVLDAQHFGVPQRRRRVFVVGYLGDWRRAAAVLFEPESLRGDSPPSRDAREGIAPTLSARAKGGGGLGADFDLDGGLIRETGPAPYLPETVGALCSNGKAAGSATGQDAECGKIISPAVTSKWAKGSGGPSGGPSGDECQNLIAHSLRGEGFDASEDGTGRGTPLVPVAFDCKASGQNGFGVGEISPTLRSMGHKESHQNAGGQVAVCFDTTQLTSPANFSNPKPGDPCHPLASGAHPPAITFNLRGREGGAMPEVDLDGLASQRAASSGSSRSYVATTAVRRLTPRECERLQGFPDDHTRIPNWNGWRALGEDEDPNELAERGIEVRQNKKTGKWRAKDADGPRYKALGNSMAVPVMRWIGERIDAVERISR